MYRAVSQMVSEGVARDGKQPFFFSFFLVPIFSDGSFAQGPIAPKMPRIRGLRTVKKEILKLIETYVQKADDLEMVNNNIVPPLLDAILVDYNRNVADARDAEVLNVMSTIISKLHGLMEDKIPIIMENVFECTLEMINKDFSEYPEHRVEFFKLLRAINLNCFPGWYW